MRWILGSRQGQFGMDRRGRRPAPDDGDRGSSGGHRRWPVWEALTAIAALLAVGATAWSIRYTGGQLEVSQQQLALVREQQYSTRFDTAIEQLGRDGNDNLGL